MRYKEYNPNRVLEQAMDLFWERSFYGCSVNDIVERTGVNRFSLYHEFDNKEGILYASLNLYLERYARPRMEILDQNAPVNETLEAFLESYFTNESRIKGCYFIHVGTEMADFDATIRSMLKAYLNDIQTKLYDLLIRSPYSEAEALFFSRHLLGLFIKVMSFCLVHPPPRKGKHTFNKESNLFYLNMPRVLNQSYDDLILKAQKVFWEQGYKGVSVKELSQELDVSQSVLYNKYSKEMLFMDSIDYYTSTYSDPFL